MAVETCLVFIMNGSYYAVDVAYAGSVENDAKIQQMPGVPSCLLGVTLIRDEIIPVVDLRSHFNLPPLSAGEPYNIIIGNLDGNTVAYQVDEIHSITNLEFSEMSVAPLMLRSATGCVQKVTMLGEKVVVLIDLISILTDAEKKAIFDFVKSLKEKEEE